MKTRIYPHVPAIKAARLKLTLILLLLLLIGVVAKADVPCDTALYRYEATIDQQALKISRLEAELQKPKVVKQESNTLGLAMAAILSFSFGYIGAGYFNRK